MGDIEAVPPSYDGCLMIPPHDVLAEQSVIGGILLDASQGNNEALFQAMMLLSADGVEFYRQDHRFIWQAILACSNGNKPVDILILNDYLSDKGQIDDVGGLSYLGTMVKDTPSAANVSGYAEIVKEKFLLRSLISIGQDISGKGFSPGDKKAKELLREVEASLFALSESSDRGAGGFKKIGAIFKEYMSWVEANKDRKSDELLGYKTRFSDIDELTSGLCNSDLIILGGRPSMGKTTLAMNMVEDLAKDGISCFVFSMEMSDQSLGMRLISAVGGVDLGKVRTPWTALDNDWSGIGTGLKNAKDLPIYVDDTPALSSGDMLARARRLKRKLGAKKVAIFIDYIQLGEEPGRHDNRQAEVSKISRGLKRMAKELDAPVVALSQLSREVEGRMDKRPVNKDLRESGAIEQDADVIMFLYRDVVYDKNCELPNRAEVILTKVRNGKLGTAFIESQLQFSRFVDYVPSYQVA